MPVLSLAKKVVKGMKASPVRVGEVVQAVDAQPANTAFLSLIGCVNLVSWLLLATAGVSLTQPLREICAVEYSLLARRKTILQQALRACDTFPMGPMSSWWSSFFPFPTYSTGMVGKGEGPRLRELAYMDPEEAKTWDHAT